MRYPASEKLEIIRLVEDSHLPARQTLAKLGIGRRVLLVCVCFDLARVDCHPLDADKPFLDAAGDEGFYQVPQQFVFGEPAVAVLGEC